MKFGKFRIIALPHIIDAYCKCGKELREVDNGWFSIALYCPKCERVYTIKLIQYPKKKINKRFLEQCRKEKHPKWLN